MSIFNYFKFKLKFKFKFGTTQIKSQNILLFLAVLYLSPSAPKHLSAHL